MSDPTQAQRRDGPFASDLNRPSDPVRVHLGEGLPSGQSEGLEGDLDSSFMTERVELLRQLMEPDGSKCDQRSESTEGIDVPDVSTEAESAGGSDLSELESTGPLGDPPTSDVGEASTLPGGASRDDSWKAAFPGSIDPEAPLVEDDFQFLELLGAGGMGEVHKAVQKSLRKHVALKVLKREALDSPSRIRRFLAEARALARLQHPHIVGVHGIGRLIDGRYFLVMDLLEEGATLQCAIKRGPVPLEDAAKLVAIIADAIEHAHDRGVIHRDLKPSNVLLDRRGEPHVTDFGLAKIFDAIDPDHPQTTADQILGTPHYMSPEQADGSRGPITPRTDVYGLGGILFALLTGRPPLEGDSITQLIGQLVSPEPVRSPRELRPDLPAAIEEICRKCLHKDASQRYGSAREVAQALHGWLERSPKSESDLEDMGNAAESRLVTPRDAWPSDRSLKDHRGQRTSDRWGHKESPTRKSRASRLIRISSAFTLLAVLLVLGPTYILTRFGASQGTADPSAISRAMPRATEPMPRATEPMPRATEHVDALIDLGFEPLDLDHLETEARRCGIPLDSMPVDRGAETVGLIHLRGKGVVYYSFSPGVFLPLGYSPADRTDLVNFFPRVLVRSSDQVRFVRISGGKYTRGDFRPHGPSEDLVGNELKPHEVEVSGFYMQETEVTNREIEQFLRANKHIQLQRWKSRRLQLQQTARDVLIKDMKMPEDQVDAGPAVCINREIAQKYAESVSGSLPTEAEWEYVARSRGQNQTSAGKTNPARKGKPRAHLMSGTASDPLPLPLPVRSFRGGDETDQQIFDMTGNVHEWCLDVYRPYTEILRENREPILRDPGLGHELAAVNPGARYVVRGGSFLVDPEAAMTFQRGAAPASSEFNDLGFRVVLRCPVVSEQTEE